MRTILNPAFFGVIILCFALPFCSIRCNGFKLYSFSGIQLVTGAEVDPIQQSDPFSSLRNNSIFGSSSSNSTPGMYDQSQAKPVSEMAIPLIIILGISVIALVMTFFKRLPVNAIGLSCAALIFILLIVQDVMMKSEMERKIAENGGGGSSLFSGSFLGITISTDIGFWLMTLISLGAIVFNIVSISQRNRPPAPVRPAYPPQYPPQYPPGYYQGQQQNYPPQYPPGYYQGQPNYPQQPNYPPPPNYNPGQNNPPPNQ